MYTLVLMASGLWNGAALADFPAAVRKEAPEVRLLYAMQKRVQARERMAAAAGPAEAEGLRLRKAQLASLWRGVATELAAPWTRLLNMAGP